MTVHKMRIECQHSPNPGKSVYPRIRDGIAGGDFLKGKIDIPNGPVKGIGPPTGRVLLQYKYKENEIQPLNTAHRSYFGMGYIVTPLTLWKKFRRRRLITKYCRYVLRYMEYIHRLMYGLAPLVLQAICYLMFSV